MSVAVHCDPEDFLLSFFVPLACCYDWAHHKIFTTKYILGNAPKTYILQNGSESVQLVCPAELLITFSRGGLKVVK